MNQLKTQLGQLIPVQLLALDKIDFDEYELELLNFIKQLPGYYQIKVLKKLVENTECDEWYIHLSSLYTQSVDGYKILYLPNSSNYIRLIENKEMISHGTTGLKIWGASLLLMEYLAESGILRGKNVIGLGSGLGFLEMGIKQLGANHVTATDCQIVLSRLNQNIELNNSNVTISLLDWTTQNYQLERDIDYLVCADVIYDPLLIAPFINTIKRLIGSKKCLIALTKRNPETWKLFFNGLVDFQVTEIPFKPKWYYYSEASPIFIFSLTLQGFQ
jgi:predicted nicotinamide N-methyase